MKSWEWAENETIEENTGFQYSLLAHNYSNRLSLITKVNYLVETWNQPSDFFSHSFVTCYTEGGSLQLQKKSAETATCCQRVSMSLHSNPSQVKFHIFKSLSFSHYYNLSLNLALTQSLLISKHALLIQQADGMSPKNTTPLHTSSRYGLILQKCSLCTSKSKIRAFPAPIPAFFK